jgi:glycine cleavage system H protein
MTSDPSFHVPEDRHYHRTQHLWARWDEASKRVRVGIDTIGLESLGELAYISLQEVGTKIQQGQPLGTLEAAKMATSITSPVSGTLVARNEAILQDPARVHDDPYGAGWLVEIDPDDWKVESGQLLSGAGIAEWVAAETRRL